MRPFRSVPALTSEIELPFLPGTAKLDYMADRAPRGAARPARQPAAPYPARPAAAARAVVGLAKVGATTMSARPIASGFEQGIGNGGEENLRLALAELQPIRSASSRSPRPRASSRN